MNCSACGFHRSRRQVATFDESRATDPVARFVILPSLLPDLLLGWDSESVRRNIFGVMFRYPQLAREGIRLRQLGQTMIEMLGGKKVHPSWMVPGGVSEPLTEEKRDKMLEMVPEGLDIAKRTYEFYKNEVVRKFKEEAHHFGNFPTLFLSLVTPRGGLEHYDGFFVSRMRRATSSRIWCPRVTMSGLLAKRSSRSHT